MTFVAKLNTSEMDELAEVIRSRAYEMRTVEHARFAAKGEGVHVVLYNSGKCVVQGKGSEQFVAAYLPAHQKEETEAATDALLEFPYQVVGSDESGKGDYFGPLVVAAVAFGPADEGCMAEVTIGDSKKLSGKQIHEAAQLIKANLPHEIVAVGPEKYNQLYQKFGNLNTLLAWCHGTALEAVLEKAPGCQAVVVDKFCEEGPFRRFLKDKAEALPLVLRPRAESIPAVGAASILASHTFATKLHFLGKEFDLTLPKGAGANVDATARRLLKVKGPAVLAKVAKMHFANTRKIGG